MRTAKRVLFVLLALYCALAVILPTFAAGIQPMSENLSQSSANLSINSNGLATCHVVASSYMPTYRISATMTLYYNQGGSLTFVNSWSAHGIGSLSKTGTCQVKKGFSYQLQCSVTVSDSNGRVVETIQLPPHTDKY